jgi:hypothetical protein
VYEPPTRRILLRCLEEERRHVAAGAVVLDRLQASKRDRAEAWEHRLAGELARAQGLVVRPASPSAHEGAPDAGADLVALDSTFDPATIDEGLARAIDVHRHGLVEGDEAALAAQIAPAARAEVLAVYRAVGAVTDATVVACARIGAYRFVKLILRGATALSVVQLEWRPSADRWTIVAVELVRSEPAA